MAVASPWCRTLLNRFPQFKANFKARYQEIYGKEVKYTINGIEYIAAGLKTNGAVDRHFERWPTLNQYVWPNPADMVSRTTHDAHVDFLQQYLSQRSEWLYNNLNRL